MSMTATWSLEPITEGTISDFIMMSEELHRQSSIDHLGYDRVVAGQLGKQLVHNPDYFCQLAYNSLGKCVGCMAGYVTPLIFSRNRLGVEEGLYVREGVHERAAIAAELLRRFVRFCQDHGAVDVRTGVISNIDNYAADVFYRRNGFKRIGSIYALRNPGGQ